MSTLKVRGIRHDTASTDAISIASDGKIGVGTSSPVVPLDVAGAAQVSGRVLVGSVGSGGGVSQGYQFAGDGNTGMYQDAYDQLQFSTGGAERMRIDSSGRVTMPYQPAFKAHTATSTSINNGNKIPFGSASINIGNHFNVSTGVFTAPVSGTYYFGGMLRQQNTGTYVHVLMYVNGSQVRDGDELPMLNSTETSTGFAAGSMSWIKYLNANDSIYFTSQSSGPSTYDVHSQTYIHGFLIG